MTDSKLVSEIYQTVNKLNDLIYEAAKGRKFTVQYMVTPLQTIEMFASYPHLDIRILTPVK
jgi:hypothetical protein